MRRPLMFLLFLGVIFGFGSGIASLRYRMHHGCHGDWRGDRWSDARDDWRSARDLDVKAPAPVPPPTPQTVVVQPSAPAAAPAPQVFVIMPQGTAAPQVVTVPAPASANVAPAANGP